MPDVPVDASSYFDPDDIATLAATEAGHYWHLARRKVLLEALPPSGPAARLLDIGCGPGTTTTFFNRQGHTVDYADVHAEGLVLARALATQELGADRTSQLRFHQFDICTDPVPAGYHGVLLLDVIEHLSDDVGALHNARAGLTTGDRLVVTVPAFPTSGRDSTRSHGTSAATRWRAPAPPSRPAVSRSSARRTSLHRSSSRRAR